MRSMMGREGEASFLSHTPADHRIWISSDRRSECGPGRRLPQPCVLLMVLLHDFNRSDSHRFERSVGTVGRHGVELVDDGLGLIIRDFTEDGVVAVEPLGRYGGDEELGAVGAVHLAIHAATQAGVRHGQQVRTVEGQSRHR